MPQEQLSRDYHPERNNMRSVKPEQIPGVLLSYPQWVCWRYVDRGPNRKPDKQPVNPNTVQLHNAGVHWSNTWSTFELAYDAYLTHQKHGLDGIGFVLTTDDPFVGIDIDNCVTEERISPLALDVMQQLQSYTEVSPSGQGLRVLVACADYTENRRTRTMEIYSHSRFLTLTGNRVDEISAMITPVMKKQIMALMADPATEQSAQAIQPREPISTPLEGLQFWALIFEQDKYGAQHLKRFQGDISFDHGDHSLAVIRLLNSLARWTNGDAKKMRSMILLSSLTNEKWFSKRGKGDWLDHQIADAITYITKKR